MSKFDHTHSAVSKQIRAMGVSRFEVGIFDMQLEKMLPRVYGHEELLNSIGFLKHKNAKGAHIYIRPAGSQGIILLDDLTITQLENIEVEGLKLACVIETSSLNYQAWLRVSESNIDADLATATAQVLAKKFNADPNSADWRHYGRLAGFTNRKPAYVDDNGRYPFVLLRESQGGITPNAQTLLNNGQAYLDKKKLNQFEARINSEQKPNASAIEFFKRHLQQLQEQYKHELDASRADWTIALRMARKGYDKTEIIEAMYECSMDLSSRKMGHIDNYIQRTVDKIFAA